MSSPKVGICLDCFLIPQNGSYTPFNQSPKATFEHHIYYKQQLLLNRVAYNSQMIFCLYVYLLLQPNDV